jgi:hypothetical protein
VKKKLLRLLSLLKSRRLHKQNSRRAAAGRGIVDTSAMPRYTGGVVEAGINDLGAIGMHAKVRATEHVIIDKEQARLWHKRRLK